MSMPLLAAMIISGGQLRRVYYLSTTLATIDALVALLGPETLPIGERKPFRPKVISHTTIQPTSTSTTGKRI